MTVSTTLGVKDSQGLRMIYIRISDKGKRAYIPTNIKVLGKDFKNGKIRGREDLNILLRTKINQVQAGHRVKEIQFSDYATQSLKDWSNTKRKSTLRELKSKYDKFLAFADPLISKITPELLSKYADYCFTFNSQNTVWASLKAVRVLLTKAKRENIILDNPFLVYKIPSYKNPERKFLTKSQIEKIDKNSVGPYLIAGTWFVIACYTGLRFSDLVKFDKSKIKGGRLIIYTSKTGRPVSMPMNKKLTELFERIEYKPLPYTNEHYNRILKALGAEAEVGSLTSHMARHTFGTLCASNGVSQEVTAKLMGHSSIRTTAIYYTLTSDVLDKEVGKIF